MIWRLTSSSFSLRGGAVFEGQLSVGYSLARRAYESLSLLAVVTQDAAVATFWDRGDQIGNAEVRKALSNLPFKEPETELRELYKFFSKGSHPNRELIPERYRGDGNGFTRGSIGRPDLLLTVDACTNLLRLWAPSWVTSIAIGLIHAIQTWGRDYLLVHESAERLAGELIHEFNRLLEQSRAEYDASGIKRPTFNDC